MEGAEYKVRKNTAWKRVLCAACAVLTAGVMTLQTGFVSLAYPSGNDQRYRSEYPVHIGFQQLR